MKKLILTAIVLMNCLVANKAKAGPTQVNLTSTMPIVLNLGQMDEPEISIWVPYPGFNGNNCSVNFKFSDTLSKHADNAFEIINQSLKISNGNGVDGTLSLDQKGSIELAPCGPAREFGTGIKIATGTNESINSVLRRVFGNGLFLNKPIDIIVSASGCTCPTALSLPSN